jgi:hypothetical protein
MKKIVLLLLFVLTANIHVFAQDDLFGGEKKEVKHGFMVALAVGLDFPIADMAVRFGTSNRIGTAIYYKSEKNWMFGLKTDFIFGRQINEPAFLSNLLYSDATLLSSSGFRTHPVALERGYVIAIEAGKIFKIVSKNPDNGLLCLTSVGFLQHKIFITTKPTNIPQLDGDFLKGYDRLANGLSIEQFVAFNHFSKTGAANFSIGINALVGITQGRRDYLFDEMKPGNDKRLDILIGIKGNWYITLFRRKSEDYYFE